MNKLCGYAGKILRVDLSEGKTWSEDLDDGTLKKWVGGVGLGAKYLYEAGLLFLEKGNRYNALKAYQSLKRTNSKELEEALHEKLFPGTTQSEVSNK